MSTGKIGIAILGAGLFAREQHLPAILACNNIVLKAVYSRSKGSTENLVKDAREKFNYKDHIEVFYDVDEAGKQDTSKHGLDTLLAQDNIQAVIIALPILTQPDIVRKCLKAGKHVLCEKPIAGTVSEAEKLIRDYHDIKKLNGKLIFSIAENWRYESAIQFAADAVATRIGKLHMFSMHALQNMAQDNKYYNTTWRTKPEHQGGFLLDAGVHYAAALRMILGVPIDSICCFSRLNKEYLPPIDTIHSTIRLVDGTTGTFATSFAAGDFASRCITILGEKGSVVVEVVPNNQYKVTVTVDKKPDITFHDYEGVKKEVHAFSEAIISGNSENYASPLEALLDLAFIESCFKSGSQEGQPIKMPYFEHLRKL